ncbi:MAG: 50S ribosomal protein L18 [Acidimicrobiales bacterium]|jgi:large subunit ribosomal protein L18
MGTAQAHKRRLRLRRHARVRKNIAGTADRPRLCVFRTTRHIRAQVIDDTTGRTLAAASTEEKSFKSKGGGNVGAATEVGKILAQRAKAAGVAKVVFDRGGFKYHGRVAAVADAARKEGLEL